MDMLANKEYFHLHELNNKWITTCRLSSIARTEHELIDSDLIIGLDSSRPLNMA